MSEVCFNGQTGVQEIDPFKVDGLGEFISLSWDYLDILAFRRIRRSQLEGFALPQTLVCLGRF
jgi:hypothetical protein